MLLSTTAVIVVVTLGMVIVQMVAMTSGMVRVPMSSILVRSTVWKLTFLVSVKVAPLTRAHSSPSARHAKKKASRRLENLSIL